MTVLEETLAEDFSQILLFHRILDFPLKLPRILDFREQTFRSPFFKGLLDHLAPPRELVGVSVLALSKTALEEVIVLLLRALVDALVVFRAALGFLLFEVPFKIGFFLGEFRVALLISLSVKDLYSG